MRLNIPPEAQRLLTRAKSRFQTLSRRERVSLLLAAIALSFVGLFKIYEPIQSQFSEQAQRLSTVESDAKKVGLLLDRNAKFQARRLAIESDYKEIEFKEGALSHLENIIKTKAGISTGFTIKDSAPKPFGGDYEQTQFSVKFTTTNLPGLIEFLREVTRGQRPMILSKVDIQRSRFADRLEVDIDVSSIKKIG